MEIIQIGTAAPPFSLSDQNGTVHTLAQYRGRWMVLYFYPKDDTSGCTKEACGMRDSLMKFDQHEIAILGVSKDSTESHKKFAEKYSLNFPLLSDVGASVIKNYGAWGQKSFMGKDTMGILRTTFLIDPEGTIRKIYEKVNPELHAQEILEDVALLKNA